MTPILDGLKQDYEAKVDFQVIDALRVRGRKYLIDTDSWTIRVTFSWTLRERTMAGDRAFTEGSTCRTNPDLVRLLTLFFIKALRKTHANFKASG